MKARMISTGEIIKIAEHARVVLDKCDSYGNPIEVPFEDIELIKDSSSNIDWQQVRIQAAITAMQSLRSNTGYNKCNPVEIAKFSVNYADELVKELKG